ncbi:hypothetical protein HPP92_005143 [Vanilla planifolia]|uniref:Uncharacterized protein n=1 Tax=Vanilla planifolia TaxID=51239 RepID=A0A835RM67_VANPL|nr:hypothetical protein HPP92_005143 [Vanilla planifolia]
MGAAAGKCCPNRPAEPTELRARLCLLEAEIMGIRREKEFREEMFALERRKQEDEMGRLRNRVEEEEEKVRRLEAEVAAAAAAFARGGDGFKSWYRRRFDEEYVEHMKQEKARREAVVEKWKQLYLAIKKELDELIRRTAEGGRCCFGDEGEYVEHMKQEKARREAVVEKWKQLYLAIKKELDELIRRTAEGGRCCFGDEGVVVDWLQAELKAKEDALDALEVKLLAVEKEVARREREIDILRQSLRILSSRNRNHGGSCIKKSLRI